MDDNGRALAQVSANSTSTLDLTARGGRDRFIASFQATKRQVARPILEEATMYWRANDRQALMRVLGSTDVSNLPELELRANCAANETALEEWAERWLVARNAPTREREVVFGEFIAPY